MGIEIKKDDFQSKGKEIIVNGKIYNIPSPLNENSSEQKNKEKDKTLEPNKKTKDKSVGFNKVLIYTLFLGLFIILIFKLIF